MLVFAGALPVWTEFAVPAVGLVLFAGIIARRQSRPTRAGSLVVLTLLLLGWLFAEGLVFRQQWPSMLRAADSYTYQPVPWEWTALLLLTYASVASLAISLRLSAQGRRGIGWACAGLAFTLFAVWTAIINYSVMLAVVCAAVAAVATWADTRPKRSPRPSAATTTPRSPSARVLTVVAATLVVVLWLLYALAWAAAASIVGGYVCSQCWIADPGAWQYKAEIGLALVGGIGIAIAAAGWLKRNQTVLAAASVVAVTAFCGWLAFYVPNAGVRHEGTVMPALDHSVASTSGATW